MISSLAWVPKGAAKQRPRKASLNEDDYAHVAETLGIDIEATRQTFEQLTTEPRPAVQDDELADYNLDDYDNEPGIETTDLPIFGQKGLTYYASNKEDPYITLDDKVEEEEELEEMTILPTDNLLIAARTGTDVCSLDIFLYEDGQDNLFVHHDLMLPSFPLCLEWLDYPIGQTKGTANYVAIGTFEPEIEIWDLDTLEGVYPRLILGGSGDPTKKKRKKPKQAVKNDNHSPHHGAVLDLSWNTVHRHLLASASVDKTVKLWDLSSSTQPDTGSPLSILTKASMTYRHHSAPVQSVQWSVHEPTLLLTGSHDKTICVLDSRTPDAVKTWKLDSDIECAMWDATTSNTVYGSTESGSLFAFDARGTTKQPTFTLAAHDKPLTSFSQSLVFPRLLVTGSTEGKVKLWDLMGHGGKGPSLMAERTFETLDKVFAVKFAPDTLRVAVAGGGTEEDDDQEESETGNVLVWNVEAIPSVNALIPPKVKAKLQAMLAEAKEASETQQTPAEVAMVEEEEEASASELEGMDEDESDEAWESDDN